MKFKRHRATHLVIKELHREDRLCGSEICRLTGLKSGTVYPILNRLERRGVLTAEWENVQPSFVGRPRRRFYSLSSPL